MANGDAGASRQARHLKDGQQYSPEPDPLEYLSQMPGVSMPRQAGTLPYIKAPGAPAVQQPRQNFGDMRAATGASSTGMPVSQATAVSAPSAYGTAQSTLQTTSPVLPQTAQTATLPPLHVAMARPSEGSQQQEPKKSAGVAATMHAMDNDVDPDFVRSVEAVLDYKASDLHMVGNSRPMIRVDGDLRPVPGTDVWSPERVSSVLMGLVSESQAAAFQKDLELDLAYAVGDLARFRVNIFRDRNGMGAALRLIPTEILSVKKLGLPPKLVELADLPRGLVLVCGPTGSGKSTTLASIVDRVNETRPCHIITVEDPIEFLHHHKKAIINQREVGDDTHSFSEALKHALRQDPDVILVGEMRDLETTSTALTAAETGHLVFATLHTQDAAQTVDRIIDIYPAYQQAQIRTQLAATLRAVIVQTLIPKASGTGRTVATEVMFSTPAIAALIREQKLHQMRSILQSSGNEGMHTLDQDLARLVLSGEIDYEKALEHVQNREEFDQLVRSRGISGMDDPFANPMGARQQPAQPRTQSQPMYQAPQQPRQPAYVPGRNPYGTPPAGVVMPQGGMSR